MRTHPNHSTCRNVMACVVDHDLCSGCGVCAGVCPTNALSMAEALNGDLTASWVSEPCGLNCGLCLAACPFGERVLDPRNINKEIFGPGDGRQVLPLFHEDAGYYLSAFVGYSIINRPLSASGGLLTWTLERLLTEGKVDRVAVVTGISDKLRGYNFVFREVQTVEDIRQAAGSVYHQVDVTEIVRRIMGEDKIRWAVTGVPCLCVGLRQAMQRIPALRRSICYLLGVACGMYQNTCYTELLLAESGIDSRQATRIEYRHKAEGRPVSNYGFRVIGERGTEREITYQGLPFYLGKNAFFRLNACNYCKDVFAEAADACFMDAWLPEYHGECDGTSIALIRNRDIQYMLEQGKAAKVLHLDQVGIEQVVASQNFHVRRKRYLINMRQGISTRGSSIGACINDWFAWRVQRYAQRRSKKAWMTFGRGRNVKVFWLAVWDVSLLITLQTLYSRIVHRIRRIFIRHNR